MTADLIARLEQTLNEPGGAIQIGKPSVRELLAALRLAAQREQALAQELAELRKMKAEVWGNYDRWLKWCDSRILERAEAAEARAEQAEAALDTLRTQLRDLLSTLTDPV